MARARVRMRTASSEAPAAAAGPTAAVPIGNASSGSVSSRHGSFGEGIRKTAPNSAFRLRERLFRLIQMQKAFLHHG